MKVISRTNQKKLPLHLSHCLLTWTELYFWGNGQPHPREPLAILNYIKAENTVNQAGNFNATFGHNDHQSFIPISHNWNPAQLSAVLNKIPSLVSASIRLKLAQWHDSSPPPQPMEVRKKQWEKGCFPWKRIYMQKLCSCHNQQSTVEYF